MSTRTERISIEISEEEEASIPAAVNPEREDLLSFCPHKDLNLPESYDQVVERFGKLNRFREPDRLN
ncbi:MAG: hypothetical protein KDB88_13220 [Flavobacteriales bacterium]|nr:hypothetical protein [Flavobacteriales bacterium]